MSLYLKVTIPVPSQSRLILSGLQHVSDEKNLHKCLSIELLSGGFWWHLKTISEI